MDRGIICIYGAVDWSVCVCVCATAKICSRNPQRTHYPSKCRATEETVAFLGGGGGVKATAAPAARSLFSWMRIHIYMLTLSPIYNVQNVKYIIIKDVIYVKCFIIRCINCELSPVLVRYVNRYCNTFDGTMQ